LDAALLPPPADPEPLPEQPAAAPTRPETTIIAAGTVTNRRMSLIGTSIVVDGETVPTAVRFPAVRRAMPTFPVPEAAIGHYT
jgi:hypothetical protein